jgi:hypothetical protein
MKRRLAIVAVFAVAFCMVPAAFAQDHDHVEVGAFADYFRLHNAGNANFWGLGGRAAFNVHSHVQLEAEMAYDFEKVFTSTISSGGVITTVRSPLRLLHGTFGPKIQTGSGAFRAFVFAKGGFLNFSTRNFTGAVSSVTSGDTNGVFYPGGGVEAYAGPIGLRLDVGDLMYFENGANHNLRVTFGPHIRF